jgi:hypothetical protein
MARQIPPLKSKYLKKKIKLRFIIALKNATGVPRKPAQKERKIQYT